MALNFAQALRAPAPDFLGAAQQQAYMDAQREGLKQQQKGSYLNLATDLALSEGIPWGGLGSAIGTAATGGGLGALAPALGALGPAGWGALALGAMGLFG